MKSTSALVFLVFAAISAFYVVNSGAPLKVHATSIGCLFTTLVLGALCAEFSKLQAAKIWSWLTFAIIGLLSYDFLSSIVIAKREFLMGWYILYPIGILGLLSIPWLASVLCGKLAYNKRSQSERF